MFTNLTIQYWAYNAHKNGLISTLLKGARNNSLSILIHNIHIKQTILNLEVGPNHSLKLAQRGQKIKIVWALEHVLNLDRKWW
ncbi:hypothetical protein HanIR_Chr07g0323721 [Helianthus annuus]|nr:hypothetical protein HanIR_Chr07g0323721 [Helianthus annuus]